MLPILRFATCSSLAFGCARSSGAVELRTLTKAWAPAGPEPLFTAPASWNAQPAGNVSREGPKLTTLSVADALTTAGGDLAIWKCSGSCAHTPAAKRQPQ